MTILALRTDKPEAELYLYKDGAEAGHIVWQAHLRLAETLNSKIEEILNKSSIPYSGLGGIAVYKGPGSFTGLRIGMSVANTLSYSLAVPIVARGGGDWLKRSVADLEEGCDDKLAIPEYGAPVRTTKPRK